MPNSFVDGRTDEGVSDWQQVFYLVVKVVRKARLSVLKTEAPFWPLQAALAAARKGYQEGGTVYSLELPLYDEIQTTIRKLSCWVPGTMNAFRSRPRRYTARWLLWKLRAG